MTKKLWGKNRSVLGVKIKTAYSKFPSRNVVMRRPFIELFNEFKQMEAKIKEVDFRVYFTRKL